VRFGGTVAWIFHHKTIRYFWGVLPTELCGSVVQYEGGQVLGGKWMDSTERIDNTIGGVESQNDADSRLPGQVSNRQNPPGVVGVPFRRGDGRPRGPTRVDRSRYVKAIQKLVTAQD
jgi:hypothetical protein